MFKKDFFLERKTLTFCKINTKSLIFFMAFCDACLWITILSCILMVTLNLLKGYRVNKLKMLGGNEKSAFFENLWCFSLNHKCKKKIVWKFEDKYNSN